MGTVFKTPKGTNIELIKLKGKDYMLVVHRLLWMNEEIKSFSIETEYLKLEDTYAVCRATVKFYNEEGRVVKSATATKKETAKDFPDFVEKCESSATGRALAMLGFGTAQSLADFDEMTNTSGKEVTRLADAPVAAPSVTASAPKLGVGAVVATPAEALPMGAVQMEVKPLAKSSFRKTKAATPVTKEATSQPAEGWD